MPAAVGVYERKQLFSPSRLMRWSHGRRFEMARRLVDRLGGRTLLDYGCGDGTFLKRVHDLVAECVATDVFLDDFPRASNVRALAIRELDASHDGKYDLVFCMEVLEHCLEADVEVALDNLRRLVAPRGSVVISVPIEIGPTLLGKHAMRLFLGSRNIGDYKWTDGYHLRDLVKMVFAGQETSMMRPVYSEGAFTGHQHTGFNWKTLRKRIEARFVIAETHFTPLAWTRGLASSQVWFVARPRAV
jgi:SAM-dependent methyltransferase